MSNKFYSSGTNLSFDISGVKSNAQVEGALVQLDLSEVKPSGRVKTVEQNVKRDVIVQGHGKDEQIIYAKTSNLTALVEEAKREHNALMHTSSYGEEMRPLMKVDGHLIAAYCQKRGITWQEFWSPQSNDVHLNAMLRDPDLSVLRLRSFDSKCK